MQAGVVLKVFHYALMADLPPALSAMIVPPDSTAAGLL